MGKLRKACANCIKYKLACEAKRPCSRCVLHQCDCIDVERKPRAARRAKRPRTALESEQCGPDNMMLTPASAVNQQPSHQHQRLERPAQKQRITSPVLSRLQAEAPYIPELALDNNEPFLSMNNGGDVSSFLLQSAEASILPYTDEFMSNSSYLSSLLYNTDQAYNDTPVDIDTKPLYNANLVPKSSPPTIDFSMDVPIKKEGGDISKPFFFNPLATSVMNPINKIPLPNPQPLVVARRDEWSVLDCNPEFVQFLGYDSMTVFNSIVSKLDQVVAPENSGYGKQSFDYLLHTKSSNFEYVASMKARDGIERTVTLRVDVLERLVIFTIKEVFDMRPACYYTKWLKSVVPNAVTACDRMNCQCKYYDMLGAGAMPTLQQGLTLQGVQRSLM